MVFVFVFFHSCVTFPSEITRSEGASWGTRACALETAAERSFSRALGVQGRELQLPESCEQKGAASPGLRWWKQFPREQRGTSKVCGNSKSGIE